MKLDKYDITFSKLVREAYDWQCVHCGIQSRPESMANVKMECSHDRSRRHPTTRYDFRNAVCACSGCHRKTTEDHDYHVEEFTRVKGKDTRELMRELSNSHIRLKDWQKDLIRAHWVKETERIIEMRADGQTGFIEPANPLILLDIKKKMKKSDYF